MSSMCVATVDIAVGGVAVAMAHVCQVCYCIHIQYMYLYSLKARIEPKLEHANSSRANTG